MNFHLRTVLVIVLTLFLTDIAFAAKILSISFFSSKSHKLTYLPLLEELGNRGHEVTLLTPIPPLNPSKAMKNVKEIMTLDLEDTKNSGVLKDFNPFDPKSLQSLNPFLMLEFFSDICKKSYDLPQVQNIMNKKYDLIFLEPTFNECVLGIIHKLGAPLILWSPVGAPGYLIEKVGGHFPSALVPNIFLGFPHNMTFFQRFLNFGANLGLEGLLKLYYEPFMEAVYREKLSDPNLPSVAEILSNQTSLILSNGHFSLHYPKPHYPDVVDVGGIHSRPAKPLPNDLKEFIEKGGDNGFILFSMGSGLKPSKMPEEKRKMFVKVFSGLKQQVLWKWDTDGMPELPKNVKLSKWLPQQDLLGHSKIKMFITHCGGGSTEEAIYHGCPLLGIPMFGDQPLNAKLAKSHGFIVELDWNEVIEESLMGAIQEILNNPQYKSNVQKLSKLFKDQPDNPLTRAVYWVEYVIRHNGAHHLRSVGRKLNFFQYHSYDVILSYAVILSIFLYLTFKLTKLIICGIWSCIWGDRKCEKAKKE